MVDKCTLQQSILNNDLFWVFIANHDIDIGKTHFFERGLKMKIILLADTDLFAQFYTTVSEKS